jgi:WD40 repeat protein
MRRNFSQGRYRLIKSIGKEGFSNTFLAVDEGRSPPSFCVIQKWRSPAELGQQQAQQLKQLGQHPQIPAVLDCFADDRDFYLVEEFIEGQNLAQLVDAAGSFTEGQIWQLLADLLPVLKFIHDRQVIHRDIKPENIIRRSSIASLDGDGSENLVLVDLRSAKLAAQIDRIQPETGVGSPEYVAPEQVAGQAVFASDIYSLGVTCIYLLTSIHPFHLFDTASDRWVWQQYLTQPVSDRLVHILDKALQKDLNLRWRSIDEILPAVGSYATLKPQPSTLKPSLWECVATLTEHSGSLASINSVAFSPKGEILASASDDKSIRLWDVNTRQVICIMSGHSQPVNSVAFSPDGKILASGSSDRTIKLWDLDTKQEICTLAGHTHAVRSVAFHPINFTGESDFSPLSELAERANPEKILASGSWDKTIKLWDVDTREEICTLKGHQLQVSAVAFSPSGQFLASTSFDRTTRLWDLSAGLSAQLQPQVRYTFTGHARSVLAVAFSPDSSMLATAGDDNTIWLWNCDNGQAIGSILGHSWSVVALAFSVDGEAIASGSWDSTVKLWQVSTGEEIATLSGHTDAVCAVAVSPLEGIVASGSKDKTIKLWQPLPEETTYGNL